MRRKKSVIHKVAASISNQQFHLYRINLVLAIIVIISCQYMLTTDYYNLAFFSNLCSNTKLCCMVTAILAYDTH